MNETSAKAARPNKSAPFDRNRLRRERTKAGLQQKELAAKSGSSTAHISRLELGRCGVSPELLHRLAEALGCTVTELMPAEPETAAR